MVFSVRGRTRRRLGGIFMIIENVRMPLWYGLVVQMLSNPTKDGFA